MRWIKNSDLLQRSIKAYSGLMPRWQLPSLVWAGFNTPTHIPTKRSFTMSLNDLNAFIVAPEPALAPEDACFKEVFGGDLF